MKQFVKVILNVQSLKNNQVVMVNMAISAVVLLAVNMLERRDLLSEAGRKRRGSR